MTLTRNPRQRTSNTEKASRLVAYFNSQGAAYSASVVARFDETQWRCAAVCAGVAYPDKRETRVTIIENLRSRERAGGHL